MRATRWNNRRVLLAWLRQLLKLVNDGKTTAAARALGVAIGQLETTEKKKSVTNG